MIVVLMYVCSPPCVAVEAENIQLAEAIIQAVNDRDLDQLDQLVSPDFTRHSAAAGGIVDNLADMKAFLEADFSAVPDAVISVDVIFGNHNFVAVRTIYSGTQSGPMGPFPATNRRFESPIVGILRIEEGKAAEMWVEWDNANALIQMGHIVPPTE